VNRSTSTACCQRTGIFGRAWIKSGKRSSSPTRWAGGTRTPWRGPSRDWSRTWTDHR